MQWLVDDRCITSVRRVRGGRDKETHTYLDSNVNRRKVSV